MIPPCFERASHRSPSTQIPDVDAVLSLFKACLRTSNQHLSNATLNALPSLLPLIIARNVGPLQSNAPLASSSNGSSNIIDVPTLRQALSALLPSGGIVDRLGDKERAQAKAREALVLLGGYAFKASANSAFSSKSGKGPETPMMFFERVVKENGLASKVWKIKEQVRYYSSSIPLRCSPPVVYSYLGEP